MPDIAKIFGSEKLSYEEFLIRAGEAGGEYGDIGELKRAHSEEIRRIRIGNALERELDHAGAKNRALVSKILDMANVTVDDDGVHGIDMQLKALRESDPYLFEEAEKKAEMTASTISTGMVHGKDVVDADSLDDAEYYRRYKKL